MENLLAVTPEPPYYAVIFSSVLTEEQDGYEEMANKMVVMARQQVGFLGIESARENIGITVSYWQSLASIKAWQQNSEHMVAQQYGREKWYKHFSVRISKVEREYHL